KYAGELLNLAVEENDESTAQSVERDLAVLERDVKQLEFKRMFSGQMDSHGASLAIQAGGGDTEAQDWAQMLLRMYLRWGEQHGFKTEVVDISDGEVA